MSNGITDIPNILLFKVTSMHTKEVPPVIEDQITLPRNKPFFLSADFQIDRWLGIGLNDLTVGGVPVFEYNVTWYSESIGPGPDYKFPTGPPSVTHAVACIPGQYTYHTEFQVPANAMDEGEYELMCRVKMSPAGGGATGFPWHVVGSVRGPDISYYPL